MGGNIIATCLKIEKLPTPEMIQQPLLFIPRYGPEYKILITQQQPMYEIVPKVAKQASWCTILVHPRYKWRLFRYNLAADQCVDDFDKAAFLMWSDNVKQEPEKHNSFVEVKTGFCLYKRDHSSLSNSEICRVLVYEIPK
ncbi:hypothetical protein MKW92_007395 [Papaver armeniacum]|nr:hypothetical protein MKW92_007395 [Papaver armeniacum]